MTKTDILKSYFERRRKPTQAQMEELIEAMFAIEDNILPATNYVYDIGEEGKAFKNTYIVNASTEALRANALLNTACNNITCESEITISLGMSNTLYLRLTSDCEIKFANLKAGVFSLVVEQNGEGGSNIIFSGESRVSRGEINSAANAITLIDIVCTGSNVYVLLPRPGVGSWIIEQNFVIQ